jgi:hypothetical protein
MSIEEKISGAIEKWDEITTYWEEGGDLTYGFLQLARNDLQIFLNEIKCNYCKKQISAEIKLIDIALQFALIANEWKLAEKILQKLNLVGKAMLLIAKLIVLELTKIF